MTDDDRYMTPPYKQRVTGSNPVVPTLKTKGLHENVALFYFRFANNLQTIFGRSLGTACHTQLNAF